MHKRSQGISAIFRRTEQDNELSVPYIHDEAIKEHGHGQPGQLQHL